MQKRKYVVIRTDMENRPVVKSGTCNFYVDDKQLVPKDLTLQEVINTPKVKKIYCRDDYNIIIIT